MKIIIFGAGIAGLTAAHELLDKGFDVSIYEKNDSVGGFARSKRRKDGMPTEHSMRGYGNYYINLFELIKRIPIKKSNNNLLHKSCKNKEKFTVYDNLSRTIKIINLQDKVTKYYDLKPEFRDYLILAYYAFKPLFSNLRNKDYSKVDVYNLFNKKLTSKGFRKLIITIRILYQESIFFSQFYLARITQANILQFHYHEHCDEQGYYDHSFLTVPGDTDRTHIMNQPTSEAWFNPWIKYLQKKGLKLYLNSSLEDIQINAKGKIEKCLIKRNIEQWIGSSSDIFIICINPFEFQKVLTRSKLLKIPFIQKTELMKFPYLTNRKAHDQIGFTLIFDKKIKNPHNTKKKNYIFSLDDSEFGILFYIQSNVFKYDPYIIKLNEKNKSKISVISGTVTTPSNIGKLYGKTCIQLNKKQILKEIIYQLYRSESFKIHIKKYSNIDIDNLKVIDSNIWYEWKYDKQKSKLISNNPKWMTNLENINYRPNQKTGISNLYLGGSHTKTSIIFWNMEGAVESGKLASNYVIDQYNLDKNKLERKDKVNLHSHDSSLILKPFQFVDDILYKLFLPNILDFLLVIIAIVVSIFTYNLLFTKEKIIKKN